MYRGEVKQRGEIYLGFTIIFRLQNDEKFLMETWMAATIVKQLSHHLRHYDFIIFKIYKWGHVRQ